MGGQNGVEKGRVEVLESERAALTNSTEQQERMGVLELGAPFVSWEQLQSE